ncbi:hypothetical protein [Cellulomonas sp. SG140]|uniref:hypothetical protein n=1 Tax=Cellulomonas sp. SG140 TaxID=2976536 RepID=UPI0021E81836|nr:hypothetical protein [Cellulomonas sp. SG140]
MSIIDKIKQSLGKVDEADLASANAKAATALFDQAADLLDGAAQVQDKLSAEALDAAELSRSFATTLEHTAVELQDAADGNRAKADKIRGLFA